MVVMVANSKVKPNHCRVKAFLADINSGHDTKQPHTKYEQQNLHSQPACASWGPPTRFKKLLLLSGKAPALYCPLP
jgi:hypothetical protein